MTKISEAKIFGEKSAEVVVIGAGLAGIEAAYQVASKKTEVLTVTSSWDTAAQSGFLPALTQKEVNEVLANKNSLLGKVLKKALFERSAKPKSYLIDRIKFQMLSKNQLEQNPYCYLWQDTVDFINKKSSCYELVTHWGLKIRANKVIVACGTFLDGQVFIGDSCFPGGRPGELGSAKLKTELERIGVHFRQKELSFPALIKVKNKTYSFNNGFIPVSKEGNLFFAVKYSYLSKLSIEKQKKFIQAELGASASIVVPAYTVKYWVKAVKQEKEQNSLNFVGKAAGATSFIEFIRSCSNVSRET